MKIFICILLSLVVHLAVFWLAPSFAHFSQRSGPAIVAFTPVKRTQTPATTAVAKATEMAPASTSDTPHAPAVAQPQPEPKPAPVKKSAPEKKPDTQPKVSENKPKPTATPAPQPAPKTPEPPKAAPVKTPSPAPSAEADVKFSETGKQQKEEPVHQTATETATSDAAAPSSTKDNATGNTTDVAGPESSAATAEPVEEIIDGRADIPVVHTFVSDRLNGEIQFTGKGRRIINIPAAPNFRLSGNTTINLTFKIDRYGNTYEIDIPPVDRDVERLLRDFVSRMRFSAVLYNEPDTAGMKINLKVR